MTTTEHHESRVLLDRFDRDVVKYMLLWAPHGALDEEDVFPEFGLTVEQFRRRFVQVVASYELRQLEDADRVLIEGARRYLRQVQLAGARRHAVAGRRG